MREIEVRLPRTFVASRVEEVVERACQEMGLEVGLRGSLARYPASLHWHLKRGGLRGTLEITFAPGASRLWLAVQAGREAPWIDEVVQPLAQRIEQALEREAAGP